MNVPLPCICVTATYSFQYGMLPREPDQVWLFTPAMPNAGGISVAAALPSGRIATPSTFSSASYLPGPQLARTFFTVGTSTPNWSTTGCRLGASETMAPTLRSRFGHPSSRLPMPGANELSTVEWQNAQVIPIDVRCRPELSKYPFTPTTAFSFNSVTVVAGSSRFTLPALIAPATLGGI